MMRRAGAALTALLVVVVGAAGVLAVDARRAHDRAPITITAVQQPETTSMASYQPGTWRDTVFILAIGSDERPGLEGARGDGLHVIGLNPAAQRATILNIPRDTWVQIPGHGMGRVNEAYHFGGAQLQAETVRRLTGAPISYVLTTTFAGFTAMVDALGGVEVDVPMAMDDVYSRARFAVGRQRMSGAQALAFSRNRHVPDGDIRRTTHQGQLIVHALAELRARGTSGTEILHYLDVLYRNVKTEGVSPTELFRLGRAGLAIPPANVRNFTMPSSIGMRGRASVVFARQPIAGQIFADFADDAVLQRH